MPLRFSIVTPTFNSARHVRETILSVIGQCGDFSVEHIIVDNCSTDGTLEIVGAFQDALARGEAPVGCAGVDLRIVSGPDRGMYDAIDKGFRVASGDVFAWLNADDLYLPGALATVARTLERHADVHWLKGVTSYCGEASTIWPPGNCFVYAREWIRAGIYGRETHFIQQDSVFWRSWLWRQAGGMDAKLRLAGDYALWIKLSELAPLVTVRALLSCFRTVAGQLSSNREEYAAEMRSVVPTTGAIGRKVRWYSRLEGRLPAWSRPPVFRVLFGKPQFAAILVGRDGESRKVSGEYHEVKNAIAGA